ncbi:uncharacterized protein LACBIDRAFT_333450 [Laccaria bicolor S238N-H82]|uniref:Predicted protein n=1 Tax=Laccaria bicolor (strain S238N-H82 / ATCC MYA-4686) TaxID=486041 RepID=B0DVY6_LACBS|nr:uncharacterized protein LACBIDRAFT_333450 [Laccaria bicolor S238N-H82]EDR01218.1 predicted protein [Laccaria bicolor S238N-H82]|eukprot:XP_001888094.1 predicted protein [Laccaria bicolor S238N-H82]
MDAHQLNSNTFTVARPTSPTHPGSYIPGLRSLLGSHLSDCRAVELDRLSPNVIECRLQAGERWKLAEMMDVDQNRVDQRLFSFHHHQRRAQGLALSTRRISSSTEQGHEHWGFGVDNCIRPPRYG